MKKSLSTLALAAVLGVSLAACAETDKPGEIVGEDGSTSSASAAASSSSSSPAKKKEASAMDDVTISKCSRDFGYAKVAGKVTNSTGDVVDYTIHVGFFGPSGDERIGEGFALAGAVQPGQTARWDTIGDGDAPKGVRCQVIDVDRTENFG